MPVISGRVLGRKKPLFADWSIEAPPKSCGESGLTLRRLIELVVREQIAAFRQRQSDNQVLRVLTSSQILEGAERGRIMMGDSDVGTQSVDEEASIAAAWQAFEDGLFLVVIDDVQHKQLDDEIYLNDDSRVTFLRLTLLAGG